MAWGCRKTCGKSIFSYQGHGIPQWRSKNKFLHAFVNKNAAPVELAQKGRLIPKAGVKKVEGKSITFVDGDVLEFDVVIACTGYREDLSFLDVELNKEIQNLYKYIFNPYDETMAFAGLIRPVLLSIPGLAEQQIKSIMKVWTGDVRLPENADMINAAKQERKYWDEFFKDSSRRIKNLVEGYAYTNDLFKTFGFYPNLKKLMLRNPKLLVYALTSPYHAAFSLLNNPECDRRVYRTLKKHTSFGWQTTPFGLVFTRLLQVDRISDCVANIKYRRQLKDLKEKTNYRKPA